MILIFSGQNACTRIIYNLNSIAFFFTLFKGYRYNKLSVITLKTVSDGSPRRCMSNLKKNCENTGKSLKNFMFCDISYRVNKSIVKY